MTPLYHRHISFLILFESLVKTVCTIDIKENSDVHQLSMIIIIGLSSGVKRIIGLIRHFRLSYQRLTSLIYSFLDVVLILVAWR